MSAEIIPASAAGSLQSLVDREIERQDRVHPDGYPPTRDGVRLGLAAAQDELDEALVAWREGRCKCPTPNCDHADWEHVRTEAIQTVAVLLRVVDRIDARAVSLLADREERLVTPPRPLGGM